MAQARECLSLKHFPTNAEILGLVFKYKSKSEQHFPMIFELIEKLYGTLCIPILSRNTIRKRYHQLINEYRKDKKWPSVEYGARMLELFHVTKCNCYDGSSNQCQCANENRIPTSALDIYFDQTNARKWWFECDCMNNHSIRIKNGSHEHNFNSNAASLLFHSIEKFLCLC